MLEHQPEHKPRHAAFSLSKPTPSPLHAQPPPVSEPHSQIAAPHAPGLAALNVTPEVAKHRASLMSHWVEAPSPIKANEKPAAPTTPPAAPQSQPQPAGHDDSFERVTRGDRGEYISETSAPAQFALPAEMTQGLNKAWDQSRPGGRSQEHGGLMVQNPGGSTAWLAGKPGTDRFFDPNFGDVKPGQTVLSTGHTHPYDDTDADHINVPFSGRDLSAHALENQRLSIVQSGQGLFGSARTKEFEAFVKARGDAARWDITAEIEQHWDTIYWCVPGDTREKAEAATRATSAHYHLLYYTGKNGKLRKVDTAAEGQHQECFNNARPEHDAK